MVPVTARVPVMAISVVYAGPSLLPELIRGAAVAFLPAINIPEIGLLTTGVSHFRPLVVPRT